MCFEKSSLPFSLSFISYTKSYVPSLPISSLSLLFILLNLACNLKSWNSGSILNQVVSVMHTQAHHPHTYNKHPHNQPIQNHNTSKHVYPCANHPAPTCNDEHPTNTYMNHDHPHIYMHPLTHTTTSAHTHNIHPHPATKHPPATQPRHTPVCMSTQTHLHMCSPFGSKYKSYLMCIHKHVYVHLQHQGTQTKTYTTHTPHMDTGYPPFSTTSVHNSLMSAAIRNKPLAPICTTNKQYACTYGQI